MTESDGRGLEGDSRDPLFRMRAYRLASELVDEAWPDLQQLKTDLGTVKIAGQLYKAIGSAEQSSLRS